MISVIVPIYNVEKYLNRCLDSIKNQSYSDFEVLMIDDGSTDRSQDIARSYLHDTRFKLYSQPNQGQGAARNKGLDNINGDYICFIDSDDYIEVSFLETLLNSITHNCADIAQCGVMRVWENGRKVIVKAHESGDAVYTDIDSYIRTASFSICNKIFKAGLFDNLRFPEGIKFEDFALAPQVYSRAKKIASISPRLYNYLWRNDSTTTAVKIQPDILKAQVVLEKSEIGRNNAELMAIFFVRQVMGSMLWGMIQNNEYDDSVKAIMQDGKEKYPQLGQTIDNKTIGAGKSMWGHLLLNGHYRLAGLYARMYTITYNVARKLYHLVR